MWKGGKLSGYYNYKIVIIDRRIIRNMKKIGELLTNQQLVVKSIEGMIITQKGKHAVILIKKVG